MRSTLLIALLMVIRSAKLDAVSSGCELRSTLFGSKQIYTCRNVSSEYLTSRAHPLNGSEWFECVTCTLDTLTAATFARFEPKNRIMYLNASACRIKHIADFAFANASTSNVKLLLLHGNHLTHLTNTTFASLRRLLQLDLSRNALTHLGEDGGGVFSALRALDILNLNANRLHSLHSASFDGLAQLKYLYLSDNQLAVLPPNLFASVPNLRILYLERNRLQQLDPLVFIGLQRLLYLYLNENSVDALVAYNFKELSALVDLQMRSNQLSTITTSAFNGLRQLRSLYLGDNNISTLAPHAFTGLDALTVLELAGNRLAEFDLDVIDDMPELRGLWLERNAIVKLEVLDGDVREHRNLASFDLKRNQLDFFNYKRLLSKLACLEQMYVGANRFRCEFFVPMYDYFEEANVTLCLDAVCDRNGTIWYTETLCRLSYNAMDELVEVSGTDHQAPTTTTSFFIIYLHIAHTILYRRIR